jgi:hypothetical protein
MSAVVEAVSNVVSSVVDAVGDVAEAVVDVAEKVVETVAENPILIVAAVAAPYALSALAAEGAVVTGLEVAATAEAVETGVAVLEATEATVAVASAETVAASTVIEAGATVAEATTAASLVGEGATVAEAVSSATAGAVQTSAITEVASTASTEMMSAWETLSNGAQNITKLIGETLAPGTDPILQKLAGQVAVNTATNGGDFGKALVNTGLSLGTGMLGSEIADATGSDFAGRIAANTTRQLVSTGDVNLTGLAGGELGRLVGSEVADETDSALAGKLAGSVTNSMVQGRDPTTGLINTGVGALVNEGVDKAFNYVKSAGIDDSITGEDQPGITKTGSPEGGLAAVLENDAKNEQAGGLGQMLDATQDVEQAAPTSRSLTGVPEVDRTIDDVQSGTETAEQIAPKTAEVTAPVGGLGQVAETVTPEPVAPPAPDVSAEVAQVTPTDEQKSVNIPTKVEEEKPTATQTAGAGAVSGALATKLASAIKPQLTSAITKSLIPTKAPTRPQPTAQQMAAMRIAATKPTRPPIQMDVSKLMPVNKTVAPTTVAPKKVNVSTLTPVTGASNLTSILKNIKKSG